ncbi:MAG: hypothetical protein H0W74_13615 [Sphingosinicella sp.]|nr:hypothetical protein [Sphingosinicella sp.]
MRFVSTKPLSALALLLILGGCFGDKGPVVSIPIAKPCVEGEIPAEPVGIEGTLTGDSGRDIGIIAGSEKEARAWGRALHGMLSACKA